MKILREVNILFVPMSHIFGVGNVIFGAGSGTFNIVMRGFDPVVYLETIAKYRVSSFITNLKLFKSTDEILICVENYVAC